MSRFRTEDLISVSDVALVLLTTAVILFVVYLFLLKFKPNISLPRQGRPENEIELLGARSIPPLGLVSVIAVHNERFVVVQTKNGITTTPLQSKLINDNT